MAVKYGYLDESRFTNIGDAIREKNGSSTQYLPSEMPAAIRAITTGNDTSDATASSTDILTGKTAYIASGKVNGAMPSKSAQSYSPSTVAQVINSGQYLSGNQTIEAVTASNIPSSLKETKTINAPLTGSTTVSPTSGKVITGVTVNAPDMSEANATASNIQRGVKAYGADGTLIVGTHDEDTGLDTSDATATSKDILDGKTAYVNGAKVSGEIKTVDLLEVTPHKTTEIYATNTYAKVVRNALPSYEDLSITASMSNSLVVSSNNLANSSKFIGSVTIYPPSVARVNEVAFTPSTISQVYAQTNIYVGSIKCNGITVVNKTATASLNAPITINADNGAYMSSVTITQPDTTATATPNDLLHGKTAYANGQKIEGTILSTTNVVLTPSTTEQVYTSTSIYVQGSISCSAIQLQNKTVTASLTSPITVSPDNGKYMNSVIVNAPDTTATATADDIADGKTAYVNGSLVTGTHTCQSGGIDTSDATATEAEILKDKTAYVNGVKITGTLETSNFYDGTTAPSTSLGEVGEFYIQLV